MTQTCDYVEPRENKRCNRIRWCGMRLQIHGEEEPRWVQLCRTCDRREGRRRLTSYGWSLDDAIKWERKPAMVVSYGAH